MAKEKNGIMCGVCTRMSCRDNYPEGIPDWCAATTFNDIIEETRQEYGTPDNVEIYRVAGKVTATGYGKWPRIQEAIEFARELKFTKIGLAACAGLHRELTMIARLFKGAGFEVISTSCQIGKVPPGERGVDFDTSNPRGLVCNPIAQAEICNRAGTQLNFIIGLCLGHDILFLQKAKAPSSVLIVKDRVTGHNPAAVLYADSLSRNLNKLYCEK